jgi:hypothetical protein
MFAIIYRNVVFALRDSMAKNIRRFTESMKQSKLTPSVVQVHDTHGDIRSVAPIKTFFLSTKQ